MFKRSSVGDFKTKRNRSRRLIAFADDDAAVCQAMKRLMNTLGMAAETFASGTEFVDRVEASPSFRPDCVILDVEMPDLNGLQVQAHLARKLPAVPVIFLTAADESWIRKQALASGAVAFLTKPVDADRLIEILRTVLNTGPANDPSA